MTDLKLCPRCGHPEIRVDGYCSVECRNMAEMEDEIQALSEASLKFQIDRDRLQAENERLREAVVAVMANPIIDGMSAAIRDDAKRRGVVNPLVLICDAIGQEALND